MKWEIRKCLKCKRYTLSKICPQCGGETVLPHPAKFSLQDKYAKYKLSDRGASK